MESNPNKCVCGCLYGSVHVCDREKQTDGQTGRQKERQTEAENRN